MDALILVDIQNDFLPGGVLAVPRGDEVVPIANALMPRFGLVIATQEWHPANHGCFASQHHDKKPGEIITLNGLTQILQPDHCIQGSRGAEFAPGLLKGGFHHTIHEGTDPTIDSYSGLFDYAQKKETGMTDLLADKGVDTLYVMGLATDYCVKHTAMDARMLGYTVFVIVDGCRGMNLKPGDTERAVEEMDQAGVIVIQSETVNRDNAPAG